jgi:hypothetical protein
MKQDMLRQFSPLRHPKTKDFRSAKVANRPLIRPFSLRLQDGNGSAIHSAGGGTGAAAFV